MPIGSVANRLFPIIDMDHPAKQVKLVVPRVSFYSERLIVVTTVPTVEVIVKVRDGLDNAVI